MGCGTSKHAVAPAPVPVEAAPASAAMKGAGPADVPATQKPDAASAAPQQTPTPGNPGESGAQATAQKDAANTEGAEVAAKQEVSLPGTLEVKEKPVTSPSDEERSTRSTPYASQNQDLGATTPGTSPRIDEENEGETAENAELPNVAVPLPTPTDVDSIKLPPADPHQLPYWEKNEPLPARPGTGSRRPTSSGGKIVVYKTAKTKKMEAEGRKKRQQDGEVVPVSQGHLPKPSALPPLKERKKKKKEVDTTVLESPARPTTAEWQGSNGGEAWSLDVTEFAIPKIDEEGEAGAPPAKAAADVVSFDD